MIEKIKLAEKEKEDDEEEEKEEKCGNCGHMHKAGTLCPECDCEG